MQWARVRVCVQNWERGVEGYYGDVQCMKWDFFKKKQFKTDFWKVIF